ncbi:hypothetical protein LS73_007825 [Helicobacter muridarum]|uniref:CAAX protease n=1 Tax=Helicobacter muridarum TaxID=216 RepID=A0A377PWI4_9HELI|nr:hypothetical protein [Helicobacter muridarum]TLD99157.1 hypothetical protein LS73_007825 [Helicobacter muridarum]STQ86880.1 CAAX protease [Helicobacter muridarum]
MDIKKLELLFSQVRLQSYQSTKEHFRNLALVGKISPKLCILEICIRNIINHILIERLGIDWIENEVEAEYRGQNLSNHQLISRQRLGFWHKMVDKHKLYNHIFSFSKSFDFKQYYWQNIDRFYHNGKKRFLRDSHKAEVVLNWIHTIRNRAFHAENLLKTHIVTKGEKNIIVPRIVTFVETDNQRLYFRIMPDKIESFLDDCLGLIDNDLKDLLE